MAAYQRFGPPKSRKKSDGPPWLLIGIVAGLVVLALAGGYAFVNVFWVAPSPTPAATFTVTPGAPVLQPGAPPSATPGVALPPTAALSAITITPLPEAVCYVAGEQWLHALPQTDSVRLEALANGQGLTRLGIINEWYAVRSRNQSGYILQNSLTCP